MNPLKPLLCLTIAACLLLPGRADEIKLKSGQTFTGRITYEAADIVKMEVPISASIKETKIIARGDIESITKDAPDDVEFGKLQKLVPTGALVTAETYRSMLETGPNSFLKNFPESKHKAKVEEIRDTLTKELDQVERGFVKVNDRWYSPQEKIDFKELIDSELRLVRLQSYSKGGNLGSFIAAMREFEFIEENYLGTPAFPKAISVAEELMPTFAGQLQALAGRVDYQNAEYERALAASTVDARNQLVAARAREDQTLKDSITADKKNGVKWTQLDQRNRSAVEEYWKLVSSEFNRFKTFDKGQLAKQSEMLVEVDKLIAEDKIPEARTKLAEASVITGQQIPAADKGSKSKSKSKSGSPKGGSYAAILNGKINEKFAEAKSKSDAAANASASEILAGNLKKAEADQTPGPAAATTDATAEGTAGAEKPAEEVDEFAALTASRKTESEGKVSTEKSKTDGKKEKGKTTEKKKSSAAKSDADEEEPGVAKKRPEPVIEDDEEGGFPTWLIAPILTVLVVIAIVVLKVTGIGGKKAE